MHIDTQTTILGLIGRPLKHSLSPLMHNLTFKHMGINSSYIPFEVVPERLADVMTAIRTLNLRGVNVTIPYKEEVIPYLDELSPEAAACGAVNVISHENGRLIGYNTDGQGFVAALEEVGFRVEGQAVFIGAGGAARSVAYEMARAGLSKIDFMDPDITRADALADLIAQKTSCSSNARVMNYEEFNLLSGSARYIVNCSPVGMHPHIEDSPVPGFDSLPSETILCDVIYNPLQTKFLRLGQQRGLRTMNGLPMFVHQGALTLEILLGVKPPLAYMKEVVSSEMEKRNRLYSA
ncbi:MAG: shikimate dehydrogenase [Syntrophomonas sp.]